jgi:hypothetical protein
MIPCWPGPNSQDGFFLHIQTAVSLRSWPAKRERASFVRKRWMLLVLYFLASFDVLAHVEEFAVVQTHGRIGIG